MNPKEERSWQQKPKILSRHFRRNDEGDVSKDGLSPVPFDTAAPVALLPDRPTQGHGMCSIRSLSPEFVEDPLARGREVGARWREMNMREQERKRLVGRGGFTLIELMTAITISGFILAAALGSFRMATRIYQKSEVRREAMENCRSALELIARDLTGAYLSSDRQVALFFGEDLRNDEVAIDSLRFSALVNHPLRTGEGTSDLAEVEYYVDTDPGTPERWLVRRYNPYPRTGLRRGRTVLAGRNVVSLEVSYFSKGEWFTSWHSRNDLPRAVFIMASALIDPEKETEESNLVTLSNVVWLPHTQK